LPRDHYFIYNFQIMDILLREKKSRHHKKRLRTKTSVLPGEAKPVSLGDTEPFGLAERISEALKKTHSYFMNDQHEDGYWWYELESNVTITAEYLMLLYFLGINDEEKNKKMAHHILSSQRTDGTWALYWEGKGDLSTTVEAYLALKLAGLSSSDPRLRKAREFIIEKGGMEASRVFTKVYLALFGELDWKAVPSIPVEIILLPLWFPFNIYNFSSWARSTIVPLSMILEHKPVKTLPENARIQELYKEPHKIPPITTNKLPLYSWRRLFIVLDKLIKGMEGFPVRPWRSKAAGEMEKWILEHQEPSGDWGGIQPAMINSVLALAAMGYNSSHESVRKGLEALERFIIHKEDEIVLQSCISPVWDTALTSLALLCSGVDKDHVSIEKACKWLVPRQIFEKGDWSVKKPDLEPGGWAFEFENNWYPDIDDTCVVLMLLNRYLDREYVDSTNIEKSISWILGMQGKDGGWGAFDVDNNMKILNQLPFGDLEAMIDPSTPDITGRVLELLGMIGYKISNPVVTRAIEFLKRTQDKEGSWWGRWGVNYIYGTSAVLVGLDSIGEDMSGAYVKKAVRWLKANQNLDGGWGEGCESYDDPKLKCCGESTASQTAWALLALIAAGEIGSKEVSNGVQYLLEAQRDDGTWEEKFFTGTGFPKHFFLRYHNYRNCFPLMALGRFLSRSAINK
jgi:squalene-hopene/tetraprenyl-beta-curcumene cyclase